jgi:hypothetical protein
MSSLGRRIAAVLLGAASLMLARNSLLAQNSGTADVKAWIRSNDAAVFREFVELLAIPNVHGDVSNLKKNAEHLRDMLTRRRMSPEVWETPGAAPTVFAE